MSIPPKYTDVYAIADRIARAVKEQFHPELKEKEIAIAIALMHEGATCVLAPLSTEDACIVLAEGLAARAGDLSAEVRMGLIARVVSRLTDLENANYIRAEEIEINNEQKPD